MRDVINKGDKINEGRPGLRSRKFGKPNMRENRPIALTMSLSHRL